MTSRSYNKRRRKRHKSAKIGEQFAAHPVRMLLSPAWRVLSRAARQFLDRLEIEMAKHAGHNKDLPLTYQDLIEYGMTREQIPPAMREAQALGFAACVEKGSGGNAERHKANRWRLTYRHNRGDPTDPSNAPTHDWQKIETLEQAKAVQRQARASQDQNVVNAARRRNRNRFGNPPPVPVGETRTENRKSPGGEIRTQPPDFRGVKSAPLSRIPPTPGVGDHLGRAVGRTEVGNIGPTGPAGLIGLIRSHRVDPATATTRRAMHDGRCDSLSLWM
jgi:hypothetical protein